MPQTQSAFSVEITDPHEFHCFRLVIRPPEQHEIEIMLHARSLVELIHQCSIALCEWQAETSAELIDKLKRYASLPSVGTLSNIPRREREKQCEK